jgi:branched-chain amino acid aminotransferase
MGVCNLFFLIKNNQGETELITPILDGSILPGVTRDSVLRIAIEMNKFKVTQREIYIDEIVDLFNQNRVLILCS